MTSNQRGSYTLGYTRATMGRLQRDARSQDGANPENCPQFGLRAATRPHEVGIASNRASAWRGEYVPGPCTHRPSHHESLLYQKLLNQP